MIYAREQLVPMDDECWRAFNAHQHEQLRRDTERCERANRRSTSATRRSKPEWSGRYNSASLAACT